LGAGRQPRGWETGTPRKQIPPPPSKKFTLRLRRGAAAVWVEVFDADLRMPRIRSAEETDEGGRGLYLVDHIASRWGTRPTKNGKGVWFEMPVTAGAAAGVPGGPPPSQRREVLTRSRAVVPSRLPGWSTPTARAPPQGPPP